MPHVLDGDYAAAAGLGELAIGLVIEARGVGVPPNQGALDLWLALLSGTWCLLILTGSRGQSGFLVDKH